MTPEAFGDYCAGPNHVLPTSRAARFSNPLGVYEFQKRSSLIECTPAGAKALAVTAGRLADAEGLQAHAASGATALRAIYLFPLPLAGEGLRMRTGRSRWHCWARSAS